MSKYTIKNEIIKTIDILKNNTNEDYLITYDQIILYFKESKFKYLELYDKKNIEKLLEELGDKLLSTNKFYFAMSIFKIIGNYNKMYKVMIKELNTYNIIPQTSKILYNLEFNKIEANFKNWTHNLGFNDSLYILSPRSCNDILYSNMIYKLKGKYDIIISIAKGGLVGAYFFLIFDFNVKIIEIHKEKNLTSSFKWISKYHENEIKNKKVLIIDKDLKSGITAKRAYDEIKKFKPKKIGISFIHSSFHTKICNIPKQYDEVHFPNNTKIENFEKVLKKLIIYSKTL